MKKFLASLSLLGILLSQSDLGGILLRTVCIKGHEFLIVNSYDTIFNAALPGGLQTKTNSGTPITVIQIYTNDLLTKGFSEPKRCVPTK